LNDAVAPAEAIRSALKDAARSLLDIADQSRPSDDQPHLSTQEQARLRATAVLQNAFVLTSPALPDNPIVYANAAFFELSGYSEGEIIGFNCRFLQGPGTDRAEVARLKEAIKRELPIQVTLLNYRKDGSTFWNELTVAPVRDKSGAVTHFVAVQTDVTALKETEAALGESERRLQLALKSGGLGTWHLDLITNEFLDVSVICKSHFGLAPDAEVTPADVFAAIHPDDRSRVRQALQRASAAQEDYQAEYRVTWPDGSLHWISASGTPTYTAAGEPQAMIGVTQDITARKRQEAEREEARRREAELARRVAERTETLARQSQRTQLLLEAAGEGFFGIDLAGRNTFVNPAAAAMLGYSVEELLGQPMHATLHHTHADGTPYPREECPIYAAFTDGAVHRVTGEVFWRKNGTCFPIEYLSTPIREDGRLVGAVVTFRDTTERQALEAERERVRVLAEALERADKDPLTGLWNHRAFQRKLSEETARAAREGTTLAVAMLDLDNFAFFNKAYGHVVGDGVLLLVAGRFQQVCRSYDTVARFGGDEFALLLPGLGQTTAEEVEARLRQELRGLVHTLKENGEAIPVTLSLGVALSSPFGLDRDEALRRADERLRRAKTGGDVETEADQVRRSVKGSVAGFSMLDALVTAVDNKDRYTRKHSEDVMEYSLTIARELGLDDATLDTIAVAALLHDVGKIGVPDAILRKPGKLTEEEFEAIKQHPTMGAALVSTVPGLEGTLEAVRHHHERWDGGGYPAGLKEKETPLMARLMAVADAFSAMTTDRPYRQGMDRTKALSILDAGSGTQWDPECVEAFLRSLGETKHPLSPRAGRSGSPVCPPHEIVGSGGVLG